MPSSPRQEPDPSEPIYERFANIGNKRKHWENRKRAEDLVLVVGRSTCPTKGGEKQRGREEKGSLDCRPDGRILH